MTATNTNNIRSMSDSPQHESRLRAPEKADVHACNTVGIEKNPDEIAMGVSLTLERLARATNRRTRISSVRSALPQQIHPKSGKQV